VFACQVFLAIERQGRRTRRHGLGPVILHNDPTFVATNLTLAANLHSFRLRGTAFALWLFAGVPFSCYGPFARHAFEATPFE
jgi:hypothetical protein